MGLKGLERQVFAALCKQPEGTSQASILAALGPSAPSQSTVSRALGRLIEVGIVIKSGATRDASFRLAPEARWFSIPGHLRPPVHYDPRRFLDYDPDQAPWLGASARAAMGAVVEEGNVKLDPSTYSREIAERFMIEMAWASSALEGNTYTLLETEVLVKYAEAAGGRSAEEAAMIVNHKNAIAWLVDNIASVEVSPQTAMRLHAMLMRGLVRQDNLGSVRRVPVNITTSSYVPSADHVDLQAGLGELCYKANMAKDPFEASFALLAGTSYLQAFIDGNKRTGRLLCNIPLLKAGLPPISFVGVDRQAYGVGMTTWYELGDPSYVAEEIASGYVRSAPSYLVANVTKRVVRSVEIRERRRFDEALEDYVDGFLSGSLDVGPGEFASERFQDLDADDLDVILTSFKEVVEAMDAVKASAYGLDPDLAERFKAARDAASGFKP